MALVRDLVSALLAEALFMLFFAVMLDNMLEIAGNEA